MDRGTREARARSFGVAALDYDAVRPGYPQELFDDLLAYARLRPGAQVLEIGCGTGQASRSLADLDLHLTCLEPGESLYGLAQSNFASFDNVQCLAVSFEEFVLPSHGYDLVFAATSFHWLDPDVRMAKCAELLVPGGSLAVFSSAHPRPYTGFFVEVQKIYEEHVPEWESPLKPASSSDAKKKESADRLLDSENFTELICHSYDWSAVFSAQDYVRLLRTFSDHIGLGEERLAGLTESIRRLIEDRYNGHVTRPYRSVLHMAKRLSNPVSSQID